MACLFVFTFGRLEGSPQGTLGTPGEPEDSSYPRRKRVVTSRGLRFIGYWVANRASRRCFGRFGISICMFKFVFKRYKVFRLCGSLVDFSSAYGWPPRSSRGARGSCDTFKFSHPPLVRLPLVYHRSYPLGYGYCRWFLYSVARALVVCLGVGVVFGVMQRLLAIAWRDAFVDVCVMCVHPPFPGGSRSCSS